MRAARNPGIILKNIKADRALLAILNCLEECVLELQLLFGSQGFSRFFSFSACRFCRVELVQIVGRKKAGM
jgi:hypothetical protein